MSKGSGKRSWNEHVPVAIWEGPPCPPGWGDRRASWAEIDKIRARAAASQQETMAPGHLGQGRDAHAGHGGPQ